MAKSATVQGFELTYPSHETTGVHEGAGSAEPKLKDVHDTGQQQDI